MTTYNLSLIVRLALLGVAWVIYLGVPDVSEAQRAMAVIYLALAVAESSFASFGAGVASTQQRLTAWWWGRDTNETSGVFRVLASGIWFVIGILLWLKSQHAL